MEACSFLKENGGWVGLEEKRSRGEPGGMEKLLGCIVWKKKQLSTKYEEEEEEEGKGKEEKKLHYGVPMKVCS